MKKNFYLLIVFLCLFSFTAKSQNSLREGFRILGGGISVQLYSSGVEPFLSQDWGERREVSSFALSPYYGRMFNDNSMLGLYFNVSNTRQNQVGVNFPNNYELEIDQNNVSYGAGTFIRRYFQISDRFGSYFQLDAGYSWDRNEYFSTEIDSTGLRTSLFEWHSMSHRFSIAANLGMYFFIVDAVSLEMSLGSVGFSYSRRKQEQIDISNDRQRERTQNVTDFSIDFINQISFDRLFTINYYF